MPVTGTAVNPNLDKLHPYPFEKLRQLFSGVVPNTAYSPISLGIGEPKHPTPAFIEKALVHAIDGLAHYPSTHGSEQLRAAIAGWIERRYGLPPLDPATMVLPVNGSREALFGFAHCVIDGSKAGSLVLCPNPFYQIYEGAAYLAGAAPWFVNSEPARNFGCDYASVPPEVWSRVQLVYVCSPGNPTGATVSLDDWRTLFLLSDEYGFVIAADECYSEIYHGSQPPLGALEAAHQLGRSSSTSGERAYRNLVVFSSLSKRSNVPGMRSGFVAGDAELVKKFLLYRTYCGGAMSPPVQAASIAAWNDEAHVQENRTLYREKFTLITPLLRQVMDVELPDAGFYLWADVRRTGLSDTQFAQGLYAEYNVTVLPGSYLARDAHGINPGRNRIRMALVAGVDEGLEAANRIVQFCKSISA